MNRKILYIIATAWVLAFIWQTYAHAQHTITHGILEITGSWCDDGDVITIDETFGEGDRACDITSFTRKANNFSLQIHCKPNEGEKAYKATENLRLFKDRLLRNNKTLYKKCD